MANRLAKRAKHAALEYQLRTLERRQHELWKERYITIELEKPLFVGYEKFFIFRHDVLSRPDFPILEKLLPLINHTLSNKNKHFTKRVRRKTKQANKEKGKKTIDIAHKIKDLYFRDWEKLSVKEQAYFYPTEIKTATKDLITVYRWMYPWMLVPKIRKKYITSIRVPNPEIQSESAYIKNFIERRHLMGKIDRIIYGQSHKDEYHNTAFKRYRLHEKEIWKEIHKELQFLDPSVYPPFLDDFSIKTKKPSYSEKNNSAF